MNTWKHQLSKDIQTLACIFPFFDTKSFTSKALFCGAVFSLINCPKHSWQGQYPVLSTVQSTPGKNNYQLSKTLSSRTMFCLSNCPKHYWPGQWSILSAVRSTPGKDSILSYQMPKALLARTISCLINCPKHSWQGQYPVLSTVQSTPGKTVYCPCRSALDS